MSFYDHSPPAKMIGLWTSARLRRCPCAGISCFLYIDLQIQKDNEWKFAIQHEKLTHNSHASFSRQWRGHLAYKEALKIYDMVEMAVNSNVPGIDTIYADVKPFFPQAGRKKKKLL